MQRSQIIQVKMLLYASWCSDIGHLNKQDIFFLVKGSSKNRVFQSTMLTQMYINESCRLNYEHAVKSSRVEVVGIWHLFYLAPFEG